MDRALARACEQVPDIEDDTGPPSEKSFDECDHSDHLGTSHGPAARTTVPER
jgi:hypothetical protein